MNSKVVGKRLSALRGDIPRRVVAKDIGISESALTMYERGDRTPRDEIKVKLAKKYKTTVGNLFFGEAIHDSCTSSQ